MTETVANKQKQIVVQLSHVNSTVVSDGLVMALSPS